MKDHTDPNTAGRMTKAEARREGERDRPDEVMAEMIEAAASALFSSGWLSENAPRSVAVELATDLLRAAFSKRDHSV